MERAASKNVKEAVLENDKGENYNRMVKHERTVEESESRYVKVCCRIC